MSSRSTFNDVQRGSACDLRPLSLYKSAHAQLSHSLLPPLFSHEREEAFRADALVVGELALNANRHEQLLGMVG